jgi:hypothetical protein
MNAVLEIWLRPWALVQPERSYRIALRGQDIETQDNHAASIWLYEANGERAIVNGRQDATEPVSGFGSVDEERHLSIIPFPIKSTPGISVSTAGQNTRIHWPNAPERPPTKLEPQTEKEKEAHRLMLRAQAVWGRLRDVETALGDPARLWQELP